MGLWGRRKAINTAALFEEGNLKLSHKEVAVDDGNRKNQSSAKTLQTDRWPISSELLPKGIDRTEEFFQPGCETLPLVKTISYTPNVSWSPHKSAWLGDYAAHHCTSKHFISRSLNRNKPIYDQQNISVGDRFNVLQKQMPFEFYLLVDLSRSKLWFYYDDLIAKKKVLLKIYEVGLGRLDRHSPSGSLTPTGKFRLGSKIIVYKPGAKGIFRRREVEMINVFGTRWIPMHGSEASTAELKGYGIHGTPWLRSDEGLLKEDLTGIGKYLSDGCIRMTTCDVEELFSIVIARPTQVEIVTDFCLADGLNGQGN